MLRNSLLILLLIVAASLCFACSQGNGQRASTQGAQTNASATPSDGIKRISIDELKAAIEKNEAVVLDVRGEVEYELGHIRGARSMPLGLIGQRASELPRDKLIVSYCACKDEHLSVRAGQEMKKIGIENTAALVGGWNAWKDAGLPTETSQ